MKCWQKRCKDDDLRSLKDMLLEMSSRQLDEFKVHGKESEQE